MNRQTILFVMNADTPDDQISAAAESAARDDDHLLCLLADPAPALPVYAYGVLPYGGMNIPDNWGSLVQEARSKQEARANQVEALIAKSNTSGDVQTVMCATVDIKHAIARAARVSDVAFLASNLRDTPDVLREVASGILFHSPIGLRMNGCLPQAGNRILVAWDSSEAASSAVHAALPYLKASSEVAIVCIDPDMSEDGDGENPGYDVAAWLCHHGCTVTISQYPSGGLEIGECLQDRALEFGADLVVMGAYGHARMIQTVLGGTTRSMMEQTKLPVLLAH
ncbi:universal stress protein [Sulfitobacter donghicola]|uniref:Universal stress protein UspA n=1 Tax=Sulfitobacter donghicola DSW-25 = KCTC 12864 = JCM 14565 TaxID=1300350 RepID=A0A073IGG0_9RHOB|nr:universal stress protein [Sulfitobacter donghicola]KEJ88551.1 universal stress protein UspA [Sulfitobacter donghicola DSW-25 = KCTC 12864 = JCM 14565]KIN69562.1 UspA protein [Sulfitobacter donghicola DSW-25 = KCTC 12864 = JCM 14565]